MIILNVNKEIISYCPNFYKIINWTPYEDDKISDKIVKLYQKYIYPKTKIEAIYLPSTSPANCKKGIEDLLKREYQKIKNFTD